MFVRLNMMRMWTRLRLNMSTHRNCFFCFHSFHRCVNLFYFSGLEVEGGMKNSFHPFHHPSAGVINKISVRKYNVLWLVSSWVESRIDSSDISANALSGLCKPDGRVVQQCCRTLTAIFPWCQCRSFRFYSYVEGGWNDGGRKVEENSSPSTHNTLMYSVVEGVEGKTEEILFDEVIVILCIIQLSVWLLSEWLLSAREKEKTLRSFILSVLSACHR